ncbi:hypothetical protein ShirakiTB12_10620 [Priestia megaterium]|uniref:Uncharacterized protein n=1 Tax=Priestia megaterium TaxID=1404 RepID=A0AAX6BFN4_PRIMG|nr:hypothetical protein ShirakiTB12_10620 [Priestia megaterium]
MYEFILFLWKLKNSIRCKARAYRQVLKLSDQFFKQEAITSVDKEKVVRILYFAGIVYSTSE